MMHRKLARYFAAAFCAALAIIASCAYAQQKKNRTSPAGYTDTPVLPGQKWKVHDIDRPRPRVITPGSVYGAPPSDAIVLFGGKDLSKWEQRGKGADRAKMAPAAWKVENGYVEAATGTGDLFTKEKFGDCQLHIEWAAPSEIDGTSQWRGNSGVLFMSRYEIQVLDTYNNPTYADGGAGSIYGQWPPLVNPGRKPGEWQTYDIVFEAPKFEGEKLVKPVYFTIFFNGVVVQNRKEAIGRMAHRQVGTYAPHAPEEPLMLQDHDTPVRFRNIWIRRLRGYDEP
jgi:hypothetical protein